MNINKKLDLWEHEKLITPKQKTAIMEFENKAKRPLFLYCLLFLSVFCIGLGSIALIAANWQQIPDWLKLGADFTILGGLVYFIAQTRVRKPIVSEVLTFLYAMLCLGTIGLIAQIYHLPSQGMTSILFWSTIVSPLVFISRKLALPLIWIPAFTISLIEVLNQKFAWFNYYIMDFAEAYPLFTGLLFICLMANKTYIWEAYLKGRFNNVVSSMKIWTIISIIVFSIFLDYNEDVFFYSYHRNRMFTQGLIAVCMATTAFVAAFLAINHNNENRYMAYSLTTMLVFTAIKWYLPYDIIGAFYTLSILSIVGLYAYKKCNTRLINIVSALMAIRFFIAYIQVFGSLIDTGLGLIISGLVFLGIAYLWQKSRTKAIAYIKGEK